MPEVGMPRLSDSMEEGTVLEWLVQVGEEVAVGDPLVEIETDKANMVFESDLAGTLTAVLAEAGESRAVGDPIARIGEEGDPAPADDPAPAEAAAPAEATPPVPPAEAAQPAAPADRPAAAAPSPERGERIFASPLARRVAAEAGVDLGRVAGSGPGGRIRRADVEAAAAAPAAPAAAPETAKGAVETVPLSRLQQATARRMAEAKATIPHFHLWAEADVSACLAARARRKQRAAAGEVVPSLNDIVVKACALALRAHPRVNGSYRGEQLDLYSRVNVGVAVAAEDALVVPTVFDADRRALTEIAADVRALAERVREGRISPPELAGGTFTVSNLGMFGVAAVAPIVNPPQAAILGVGEVRELPVVADGELATRQVLTLTLGCDHRVLNGADAARFLADVKARLEDPLALAG